MRSVLLNPRLKTEAIKLRIIRYLMRNQTFLTGQNDILLLTLKELAASMLLYVIEKITGIVKVIKKEISA